MQLKPKEQVIIAAANLSRTTPDQWRTFLSALDAYSEAHRENLLQSPLPELPVNQGKAQSLTSLLRTLKACEADADKIRKTK